MIAMARCAMPDESPLLKNYVAYCHSLPISDRSLRGRLHAARQLLARHPNLTEWMNHDTTERLELIKALDVWPFVVFLIGTGQLRLDLPLAMSKNLTGLGALVESAHSVDFAAARAAGTALGWTDNWVDTVVHECLVVIIAWHGASMRELTVAVLDTFDASLDDALMLAPTSKRAYRARLASLRQILFELAIHANPPRRGRAARTLPERFQQVEMPGAIRQVLLRYAMTRSSVLRPRSVESLVNDLLPFAEFLTAECPEVSELAQLRRVHIENFLLWNRTRPWRGRKARAQPVTASVAQSAVLTLRNLLEDILLWGWEEAPPARLVFAADIPKLGRALPRALPPDIDGRLMAAVAELPDIFARYGLQILRSTGLRVGELLDLEVDAIIDYGAAGTWLHVPMGKLATERSVPLDTETQQVLARWQAQRRPHRPLVHPRTGTSTHFLFTEHGRRLGPTRLRNGLLAAIELAGLRDSAGDALTVTPHQLRHTYATALANAGMSLQALMALLGHVTPEMTIRYATLASPTLRDAYDQAMGIMRRQLTLTPVGRPIVPDKISWLSTEMLKTRLAHGYCSRHESQGPCPYANICETCDNFTPANEFTAILTDQLADIRELQTDAQHRGWTDEEQRHNTVATAIEGHINRVRDH
jgi:site-specific recombinase XerD